MERDPDVKLLEAWRGGDQDAGSRLLRQYFKVLRLFFVNKVGGEDELEDLIQQTMLRCVQGREHIRGEATFKTYLFIVARRTLADHHRTRRSQEGRDQELDMEAISVRDLVPDISSTSTKTRHRQHKLEALGHRSPPSDDKPEARPPDAGAPTGVPPVDVVLLTALHEEYLAVLEVDDDAVDPTWIERPDGPNGRLVARRRFRGDGGHAFTVLATWADGMAGNAAAAIAGMLVSTFKPRCLAMTGIAAGPRGKTELGDVVFGRVLFTHDTGKVQATGAGSDRTVTFKGDLNPFRMDHRWKQRVEAFGAEHNHWLARTPPKWARDKPLTLERQGQWVLARLLERTPPAEHPERTTHCPEWKATIERLRAKKLVKKTELALTKKGERDAREHADLHPGGSGPPPPVSVRLGDIASGSAVIEDGEIFARIEASMRKTIGLEMEAAAIAAVAELGGVPWLVAKAICDFGDSDKDDHFHGFAARASAECLLALLRRHSDLLGPRTGSPGQTSFAESTAGSDPNDAGDGQTTAVRHDLEVPEWPNAVEELKRILQSGPSVFVRALATELGLRELPPEGGARPVARAINQLGAGPPVAKQLLRSCIRAVRRAKQEQPERRRAIVEAAVELAVAWLPRRYRDARRAWRIVGRTSAASDGYCDDLALETQDPIMIDVHVSGAEGIPSDVKVIRRPPGQGGSDFDFIGARRFPEAEAALAEMRSAPDVAEALTTSYATKLGFSPGQSESSRRTSMRSYLESLRDMGEPRYLVDHGQVTSETTLVQLKRSYPALRLVTLVTTKTSADRFEAKIVPVLKILLSEAHAQASSPA